MFGYCLKKNRDNKNKWHNRNRNVAVFGNSMQDKVNFSMLYLVDEGTKYKKYILSLIYIITKLAIFKIINRDHYFYFSLDQ